MSAALRYAVRTFLRSPGFALTAILALALGIGASTAIFSAVNSILFHPTGVVEPDRMVAIRIRYDKLNLPNIGNSAPDFNDIRNQRKVFSAVAVSRTKSLNYATPGAPVRLLAATVSSEFFDVYGRRPELGRSFTAEEDLPNAGHVAVLDHRTWTRYFGGDPSVVGRTVELSGEPYRIIGVMPADFHAPSEAELWVPLALDPKQFTAANRHNQNMSMLARLQPGVSFERARETTAMLTRRVLETEDSRGFARGAAWSMFAVPYLEWAAGDLRTPMYVLLGAEGFVLLIACSNIAGLLLARASGRTREMAVRAALGASRWQIVRQLLTESGVLAAVGGALGLAFGAGGIQLLLLLAPRDIGEGLVVTMDYRVLLFALGATVAAGILFGLAPAWQLSHAGMNGDLREGGRSGTASGARQRMRAALVVAEVAIALVLLIGAGLLLRSLERLQGVDTGFRAAGVTSGMIMPGDTRYKEEAQRAVLYRSALDRLRTAPGVESVAAIVPLPFGGDEWSASFDIEGRQQLPGDPGFHGNVRYISPEYFATMGIPIRGGRVFTDQDAGKDAHVVVIDEALAAQYWPNENPIGRHLRQGGNDQPWQTIVGVVAKVRHSELASESKKGTYYFPIYSQTPPLTAFVIRGSGGGNALRAAVGAVDPTLPVFDIKTMDQRVNESLGMRRFAVTLLSAFATIALALASLGIYGVISYAVTQRTREIGIRMALGAERSRVLGMVLGQGIRLAAGGVVVGLILSAVLTRLVATQLYQVSRFDPLTFGATALVLTLVSLAASYLPARRAMSVDPMVALRYE